jgi:hypothetical protein
MSSHMISTMLGRGSAEMSIVARGPSKEQRQIIDNKNEEWE